MSLDWSSKTLQTISHMAATLQPHNFRMNNCRLIGWDTLIPIYCPPRLCLLPQPKNYVPDFPAAAAVHVSPTAAQSTHQTIIGLQDEQHKIHLLKSSPEERPTRLFPSIY